MEMMHGNIDVMYMHPYSLWHWLLAIVIWWLLLGWPISKILRRMGFSGWWVLLTFVPLVNIIGLWGLATSKWPKADGK